jgi:hypothetical protein
MSKKSKPRWDFSPTIDVAFSDEDAKRRIKEGTKFIKFDTEALSTIEEKADLKLDEMLKDKLRTAIIQYKAGKELVDNRPRVSEQRAALKTINKLSNQLKDALENCDSDTRMKLILESDWINIEKTIFILENINHTTDDILKKIPTDKGGRPTHASRKLFIQDLAKIFKKATGEDASVAYNDYKSQFYSPFLSFVEIVLDEINDPPYTNQSLGSTIQRAIKDVVNGHALG